MDQSTFNALLETTFDNMRDLLGSKGADYAPGKDRLENFKSSADILNIDPLIVWAIYFNKHLDAIFTFVKHKRLCSESIQSRFHDALNYLVLGLALIKDLDLDSKNELH